MEVKNVWQSLEPETVERLLHPLAFDDPHPFRAQSAGLALADKARQVGDAAGVAPFIVIPRHNPHHALVLKNSGHQSVYDT